MAPSVGQICNLCKWRHVVAKFSPSLGVNFWVRCASGNVLLEGHEGNKILSTCIKQGGDLFYSPYSIVISSHQLASLPSSTSSLLLCSGCNKELGEVEEERESATLWADAILISSPSLEAHSVPPIQGISTSEDLFMAMVNLMVSQSPELMPKVVVKSRSISGLLLWVVDKNLRLLKGSQDKVAEEQTVLKILFKELTMEDGQEHSNSVMVPKEVVESGYKLLEDSTRHFPGSMRSAQGFSIGHISKG